MELDNFRAERTTEFVLGHLIHGASNSFARTVGPEGLYGKGRVRMQRAELWDDAR